MKKFIAILACLTMLVTLCAGMTVSAANYGSPTLTLTYTGDNASGYAKILVKYSGFENFVEPEEGENGVTVTGIAGFQLAIAANANATYQGGSKKTWSATTKTSGKIGGTWADTDGTTIVTNTSGDAMELRFAIADTTKDTTITAELANFSIKKYDDGSEISEDKYYISDLTVVPAVIPAKVVADVAPWDVTYATATNGKVSGAAKTDAAGKIDVKITPKFGYELTAVKYNGVANATALAAFDAKLGGTANLTLTEDTEIAAEFTAIPAEGANAKPALTFGKPYKDNAAKEGANFGKISTVAGKVIEEVGMYLEDSNGAISNTKIATPGYFKNKTVSAADTLFGVKWTNMPADTYKVKTYVKYVGDPVIVFGDEVTFVVE